MTRPPIIVFLQRDDDVTGVSGTGIVAHGVVFADDTLVLKWLGEKSSTVLWQNVEDALKVHGHDGRTRFITLDGEEYGKREGMTCSECGSTNLRKVAIQHPQPQEMILCENCGHIQRPKTEDELPDDRHSVMDMSDPDL